MVIIDTTNIFTRTIYRIIKAIKKEEYKITVTVIGSDGMDVTDMQKFIPSNTKMIVTGNQNRIDESARTYADNRSYETMLFEPLYDENGQELRSKRIEYMVKCGDMVVAFWDESSEEIKHAVSICKKRKIPVKVYIKDGQELKKI